MALPDYLQDTAKDFGKQLTATTSVPIDTGTFTGRQFVAGEDPLQSQAINLATSGIGSYQPFLTAAQGAIGQQAASAGPQAFQNFMSPFQSQVIDTTLADFDRQAAIQRQGIRDNAVTSGAFGGGREGVQMAEYDAASDRNRAATLAQLQASGLADARAAAQQNFTNQGALAAQQFGLSNFQRGSMGQDVSALGNLGAFRQGITSAQLQADANAARAGAYEPIQRLDQYGAGLGKLAGFGSQAAPVGAAGVDPLTAGISNAVGLAGIFGKLYGSK